MEFDELVQDYIRSRNNFSDRIQAISLQIISWSEKHEKSPPTLRDVAQFEGLRAERARLLSEFTEREDQFVLAMLRRVGGATRSDNSGRPRSD